MAKQPTSKGGTSRIRFIMLDAEIPEGDLHQLTSAIQNALKPTAINIQQRIPPAPTPVPAAVSNGAQDVDLDADGAPGDNQGDAEAQAAAPRPAREPRQRKYPSMRVLNDLDLTGEPSFKDFASEHAPNNETERHLVVLAWFKEHQPDEAVTAHHVYTCYRTMKWPTGIEDFPKILRSLKAQQLVKQVGRAQFEINHLGIARLEKPGTAP